MKKLHKVIKEGEFIHILNEDGSKLATTDKSLTIPSNGFGTWVCCGLKEDNDCTGCRDGYNKISAKSLPQIPQDFIKYFVIKQGNVGKVRVKYHDYQTTNEYHGKPYNALKLTKDNEVIISLEEKSYTRDEVKVLFNEYRNSLQYQLDFKYTNTWHDEWIEQNL